jgi:hypothetical protein
MAAQTTFAEGWEWPEDYMAIDEQELELPVPEEIAPAPIVPCKSPTPIESYTFIR